MENCRSTLFEQILEKRENKFDIWEQNNFKRRWTLPSFFWKTVDELKIPNISNYKLDNTNDPLKEALRFFENHPSITNIKSKNFDASFTFRDTSSSEVLNLSKS